MTNKLSADQFASLELTELNNRVVSRGVTICGDVDSLVTVAAYALPVLDSRLEPEQTAAFIAQLQEGEMITPSLGHFSLRLVQEKQDENAAQTGELHIKIAIGPNGLMALIRKALEASVDNTNTEAAKTPGEIK